MLNKQAGEQLAAVQRLQNAVAMAVEAGVSQSDIREWVDIAIQDALFDMTMNDQSDEPDGE